MKKLMILGVIFFFLNVAAVKAQSAPAKETPAVKASREKLTGIWRIKEMSDNNRPKETPPEGMNFLKILMADGKFANVMVAETARITVEGEWHVISETQYAENIKKSRFQSARSGMQNKITFRLKDNNNTLVLKYTLGGDASEEVWEKLESPEK